MRFVSVMIFLSILVITSPSLAAEISTTQIALTEVNEVFPESFGALGDGVADDTESIQNAINSVKSAYPGTVKFTRIYRITRQISTGPLDNSFVSLEGNGTIYLDGSEAGFSIGNSNTHIDGLRFIQNQSNGFDPSYSALNVQNVGYVTISRCGFDGLKKTAITINAGMSGNASDISISESFFQNNSYGDIILFGHDATHAVKNVSITGNTFISPTISVGTPTSDLQIRAIHILPYSSDIVVSGNVINGTAEYSDGQYISGWRDAIQIGNSTSDGRPDHVIIANNTISGMSDDGVGISGAVNITITGNAIYGSLLTSGIYVPGNGTFRNDMITISGNTINNCGNAGIFLKDTDHATVSGNNISNSLQGIAGVRVMQINISGNTITTVAKAGIFLNAISQGVISNNLIDGFHLSGSPSVIDHAGIFIDSGEITIIGNSLKNGTHGIVLNGAPGKLSLMGNTGHTIKGYGINFVGFSGTTFNVSNNALGGAMGLINHAPASSSTKILEKNI